MKKVFLLILLFAAFFTAQNAEAQVRFGVKGGATFVNPNTLTKGKVLENMTGYQIGPMIEASIPVVPLSIDAALLFTEYGSKLDTKVFKSQFVELPVNLKLNVFNFGAGSLMVLAGPTFSYLINNSFENNLKESFENFEAKKLSVGLNAGVGIELFRILQLSAAYRVNFTENYKFSLKETPKDFINAKNKGFVVSAAILF